MNLPFRRNKSQSHRPLAPKAAERRRRLVIVADIALILFAVAGVSSVGIWTWEATRVITREDPAARFQVRLQIVNATGQKGVTKIVAERIEHYGDGLIEVSVVDTDDLRATRIAKSFVINRDGNTESSTGLAARLGIAPAGLTVRRLDHNSRQVTTTLVLGEDWHKLKLPNS